MIHINGLFARDVAYFSAVARFFTNKQYAYRLERMYRYRVKGVLRAIGTMTFIDCFVAFRGFAVWLFLGCNFYLGGHAGV